MTKIKVLQLANNYKAPFVQICHNYNRLFNKNEYDVTTVYLKGRPDDNIRKSIDANHVLFFNLSASSLRRLKIKAIWQVAKLCKKEHFDIVICHRYKAIYVHAIASFLFPSTLQVAVIHGLGQFNNLARKFFAKLYLRKKYKFIGVSEAIRNDLTNKKVGFKSNQVFTLPNAIDVEKTKESLLSKADARKILHLNDNQFIIGNVGRLSPSKDQSTLLQAFAQANIPNSKLVIIGAGRLDKQLKKQAKSLGIENIVAFTNEIPNAYRVMPAFDIFTLTSVSEGFGQVLLEAMVTKLPIVATNTGGIKEVLHDSLTMHPCGDINAIANGFTYYYTMPIEKRQIIGEKMLQHVNGYYSENILRERALALLTPDKINNINKNKIRRYRKIRRVLLPHNQKHMADLHPSFQLRENNKLKTRAIVWKDEIVGQIQDSEQQRNIASGACYIVATGPSLTEIDLNKIKHYSSIGVNGAIVKFIEADINPTHYVVTDSDFFETRFDMIKKIIDSGANCYFSPAGISRICEIDPSVLKNASIYLLEVANRIYNTASLEPVKFYQQAQHDIDYILPTHITNQEGRIGFSRNICKGVFCARTITYRAIQVAYYIGYRKLFLLGMDLNGSIYNTRFYESGIYARPSKLDRDFDPYIKPSFEVLQSLCQQEKLEVYNISAQSRLPDTIIPKIDFNRSLEINR